MTFFARQTFSGVERRKHQFRPGHRQTTLHHCYYLLMKIYVSECSSTRGAIKMLITLHKETFAWWDLRSSEPVVELDLSDGRVGLEVRQLVSQIDSHLRTRSNSTVLRFYLQRGLLFEKTLNL